LKLAKEIEEEFPVLWDIKNYAKGKENYLNALKNRCEELKDYIK